MKMLRKLMRIRLLNLECQKVAPTTVLRDKKQVLGTLGTNLFRCMYAITFNVHFQITPFELDTFQFNGSNTI